MLKVQIMAPTQPHNMGSCHACPAETEIDEIGIVIDDVVHPIDMLEPLRRLPIAHDARLDLSCFPASAGLCGVKDVLHLINRTVYRDDCGYLSLNGRYWGGTFQMDGDGIGSASTVRHICTAKNLGQIDAIVSSVIRDASSGQMHHGRLWILPPGYWSNIETTYEVNPFTNEKWKPGELSDGRYRFGLQRDKRMASVGWQRSYLEIAGEL